MGKLDWGGQGSKGKIYHNVCFMSIQPSLEDFLEQYVS